MSKYTFQALLLNTLSWIPYSRPYHLDHGRGMPLRQTFLVLVKRGT
jgi:hypothetical protein